MNEKLPVSFSLPEISSLFKTFKMPKIACLAETLAHPNLLLFTSQNEDNVSPEALKKLQPKYRSIDDPWCDV